MPGAWPFERTMTGLQPFQEVRKNRMNPFLAICVQGEKSETEVSPIIFDRQILQNGLSCLHE